MEEITCPVEGWDDTGEDWDGTKTNPSEEITCPVEGWDDTGEDWDGTKTNPSKFILFVK